MGDSDFNRIPQLIEELKILDGISVDVGWRGEMAEIAAVHEYGATIKHENGSVINIPERAPLRKAAEDEQIIAELQNEWGQEIQGVFLGKTNAKAVLDVVGAKAVALIRNKITDGLEPENAPSTIRQKGSAKPLIDTGTMLNELDYWEE